MNEGDKSVLKRYHQQLADDIIVDEELLGGLYTEGVFEKGMIAIIRSQSTPEKIQKLLELLPKRGPSALTKFIKVIETTYPWLATILISASSRETANDQHAKASRNSHSSNKRLSSTTSAPDPLLIDRDIKQIVAAFVHRQFGQSKRISEKDKKTVEHFLSDQIQGERNRYQRLLCSASETPDLSRNQTPDDVFTNSEVLERLYSIHTKLEPIVLRERLTDCDADLEGIGGDDDGHPDYRNNSNNHPRRQSRPDRQVPKLFQEDMDFDLIDKEVDIVLGQIDSLSGRLNDCLRYFESTDCFNYPLATLVGRTVSKCRALEDESSQDRHQIKALLNERDVQSDAIARLETERTEHRKQIQAAFLDMASLRQEKGELRSKMKELEHSLSASRQLQQPHHYQSDRRGGGGGGGGGGGSNNNNNNLQYGLFSKSTKITPRGGRGGEGGGGGGAGVSSSMTGSIGGQYSAMGAGGGGTGGQFIKNSSNRPGNSYLTYARRGPVPNRYGVTGGKKKQMTRSDTNLSSTAKF